MHSATSRSRSPRCRAHAIEVLLRTDLPTAKHEVFSAFGVLEPDEDGVLLFAQADDLAWFALELSRLPFDFVVRRPAALRDAVRDCGERLQRLANA
jgi:predicted DNA-binding transcriptional regulator YafY